jgi:hypothetical protein
MAKLDSDDSRTILQLDNNSVEELTFEEYAKLNDLDFSEEEFITARESYIEQQLQQGYDKDGFVSINDLVTVARHNIGSEDASKHHAQKGVWGILRHTPVDANRNIVNGATYFAETSSTLMADEYGTGAKLPPEGFLVDPVSRDGTSRTDFNLEPCGGGIKGKTRYLAQPGETFELLWIIKNPVPNGHCQLKISKGRSSDSSSFETLHVKGKGFDPGTGKFNCGNEDTAIESAVVQLPYDTSCPDCTIQWVYDAPGYGKMYQCADISVVDKEKREDCSPECLNGGV